MKQEDTVQSVDRALSIVEVLSTGQKGLQEISNLVKLNKSTVHRLLQTLIFKGFVSQDQERMRYGLTTKILQLSQKIIEDLDVVTISKPYLQALNNQTEEVVHLVMIEGKDAVYIDKMEAKNNIRMYSYIGKRIPLFSSAVGKAYLAFSPEFERASKWQMVMDSIVPLTKNTIVDEEALLQELEQIRLRGFSIDNEENELGIICVAAPIYNHLGKVEYAISISTPKFRLTDDKLKEYGNLVKGVTAKISKELGYQG
ncbi:IclR family transcriptional regulator [Fusibacter bizertensis]